MICVRPKLYFVKVDVQACFDTIEQTKLLQILREILSEVCATLQFNPRARMTMRRMHTPSNAMGKCALRLEKYSATMSRKLSQKVRIYQFTEAP